jgi:sugar phosphate isomerase/epimerase
VADYVKFPRFSYEHKITNYLPEDAVIRAVPVGTGIIDYQTFLKTLKEIGYQGYIAYEMCEILEGGGSVENLDWTARRFLEFVEQFK